MSVRVVADHHVSRKVIASRDFSTFRMADQYRLLASRIGHDFSASIALLERLPTFMEGPAHKATRKAMALRNEANKVAQLAATDAFLRDFTGRQLHADNGVDLMEDFALPLLDALTLATTAAGGRPAVPTEFIRLFPSLFSSRTPLSKRIAIDRMLVALTDGAKDAVFDDLALMVLGIYPLSGSLALTLHATFSAQPQTPLHAIRWPDRYATSALHYVDRVCARETKVGDQAFTPGERARCLIQSPAWTHAQNQGMTFGAGAHLCLGRQLSEAVWDKVIASLSKFELTVDPGTLTLEPGGEPFDRPAHAYVTFRSA